MESKVNKRVAFHTLGCKVNIYETEVIKQLFHEAGYVAVGFDEEADYYFINTCSVTNIADRKSRQMIGRCRKQNPAARVIVSGCYADGAPEEELRSLGVDFILDNETKKRIVERAGLRKSGHVRADVKIEDGCNQFCSYCIIPYRRGRVTCRQEKSILKEIGYLADAGHKEIVLTGIHISSYGRDELLHLIAEAGKIPGIERIRLGSLEPRIIDETFLAGLKEIRQFCPHFHLSLQSGCNRTLKAMNRHYCAEEFEERTVLIRNAFTHPAITTDVICGFPGETREDFLESKAFAEKIAFSRMHIFPYSRREGTAAARMPGQITNAEKKARAAELEEIDRKNAAAFLAYYVGKEVDVLSEEMVESEGQRCVSGLTDTYVRVLIPGTEALLNRMVRCRVNSSRGEYLTAEVIS